MTKLSILPSTPVYRVIAAIVGLAILFGFSAAARALADENTPQSGERLISIHDRGIEKGILTKETTLRKALVEANIAIDANDLVEPSLDDELVANSYQVNIYRARPVLINDNGATQKVLSAYQTPKQIAEHAGITLHDEDKAELNLSTDMVSQGASLQLDIDRATPFTLVLYGKTTQAYAQEATVGDMMKAKAIHLGKSDTVSVPASTPLRSGMTVEIWRDGVQTLTQDEDITFPVEKIQDADHEIGYREVKTAGENGKKTVSYEVEMKSGKEASRKIIQSVITKEPKSQVEVIGTKVNLPPGSHQDWMAAAGIPASDFGYVEYIVGHEGGWVPCKVQGGAIDCTYAANGGRMGYGIVQATPGGKMASAGTDWATNPITQLRWATGYAVGRYGSWSGAYSHWLSYHNW